MKYTFVFFLLASLFIAPGACRAQSVTYSAYENMDFKTGQYDVVGMVGRKLFIYRKVEDSALLEAFDESMNKTALVILDFLPERIYQIHFIAYSDKILLFYL